MTRADDGFAVVLAMLGILVIGALGAALVLVTSVETTIARHFRDNASALFAAEGAAAFGALELGAIDDWTAVLAGSVRSAWQDGDPEAAKTLSDGSPLSLSAVRNLANCGSFQACSEAQLTAVTEARPWGPNNPRWQPFGWGRLADLIRDASPDARFYALLLVADDPAESDDNPLVDAQDADDPGSGVVMLRAEVFGPGGAHAAVELAVARRDAAERVRDPRLPGVRVVTWRAVR